MSVNSEKHFVSGYARAALVCAVFSFICVVLAFVTPFWLQSWPRVHTPMDRLGLWEFCLDGLVHRLDPEMRSYFGCWWSFAPEFYPIRDYLMPPWFRFVQFCITFSLLLHIVALILCVAYVVRCIDNPERRALVGKVLAYAMLLIGTLLGVGIIVFGAKCLDPYWLPNPELNWPSWSFGLAILSAIFCFFTCAFMVPQVKLDKELIVQREFAFPMTAVCRLRLNKLGVFCLISGLALIFLLRAEMPLLGSGRGVSIKELLSVSIELCERAGQLIIRHREALKVTKAGVYISGGAPPVTQADLAANAELVYGFHKSFPWLRVVSEEAQAAPLDYRALALASHRHPDLEPLRHDFYVNSNDLLVWVDPLDGTQEFTEHLLAYVAVQVCVAYRGSPLLGVLHFPFANRTYWAWRNLYISDSLRGNLSIPLALLSNAGGPGNGTRDDPAGGRRRRLLVSRSHRGPRLQEVARGLFPNDSVELLAAAGAGYKLLLLGKGLAENYVHAQPISKWDLCAGHVILDSLGGSLAALNGARIDYGSPTYALHLGGVLGWAPGPASLSQHQQQPRERRSAGSATTKK